METLRRFGVEIEVNAFSEQSQNNMPDGICYVGNLVSKILGQYVELRRWNVDRSIRDRNYGSASREQDGNNCWVVKPDSSCGIEVCSPISKGNDLQNVYQVIDGFARDDKIKADQRCSLHVHVDVSDCTLSEIAAIITYWIKCEPVFLDSVPHSRKNNRYCEFIGLWDLFNHDSHYSPEELIKIIGTQKYLSMNSYHLHRGKRLSIEFRIGEGKLCKQPSAAKNWIQLILQFVDMSKRLPLPVDYELGNPWSSWLWLDPIDVFKVLGFDEHPGLREWFLRRLVQNASSMKYGALSEKGRRVAHLQVLELSQKYGI